MEKWSNNVRDSNCVCKREGERERGRRRKKGEERHLEQYGYSKLFHHRFLRAKMSSIFLEQRIHMQILYVVFLKNTYINKIDIEKLIKYFTAFFTFFSHIVHIRYSRQQYHTKNRREMHALVFKTDIIKVRAYITVQLLP